MSELNDATARTFIQLIHQYAGITMDVSKKAMIQNRLSHRLRDLGLANFEEYLTRLRSDAGEARVFVDQLTTNETYFFRTPRIWEYIREKFLPEWIARNPGVPFRAWSAAASSGEEACTLGILLQEFREKNPSFQYQILGTDICGEVLERAEAGRYSGRSIELFKSSHPGLFAKYMEKSEDAYRVTETIRSRIRFQRHNLFEKLSCGQAFDLVLIRNVLIYFSPPDQEAVLSKVSLSIKPGGTLIIGESESLNGIATSFAFVQPLIYGAAA